MTNKIRVSPIVVLGIILSFSVPATAGQALIYTGGDLERIRTLLCKVNKAQLDTVCHRLGKQLVDHKRWDGRTQYIKKDTCRDLARISEVCLSRVQFAVPGYR
jgi:hypothetical protein